MAKISVRKGEFTNNVNIRRIIFHQFLQAVQAWGKLTSMVTICYKVNCQPTTGVLGNAWRISVDCSPSVSSSLLSTACFHAGENIPHALLRK